MAEPMGMRVDPELSEAMAAVEPHPASKSRLIRDLALRGAEAAEEERGRREAAKEALRKIADGEISYAGGAASRPPTT